LFYIYSKIKVNKSLWQKQKVLQQQEKSASEKEKAVKLKKLITNTIVVKRTIVDKVDNYE